MYVDQTKLLDRLAYQSDDTRQSKGIANYIESNIKENAIGVAGTGKKEDAFDIKAAQNVDMSGATYLRPGMEQDKTVADSLEEDNKTSAMDRYNEMAVISNTTSEEDLKKMQEEGYSLSDTDSKTIVTVTDKIKATLAKAGVDISIYGDRLSKEQLEEITGNAELASQIVAELSMHDLPITPSNIEEMAQAEETLQQITPPGDTAIAYLIKNNLSPSIENLYRAEFSAKEDISASKKGMLEDDFSQMREQIEKIIQDAGLAVNQKTMEGSRFLITAGLPLTAENLAYWNDLTNMAKEIDSQNSLAAMCDAIAEGKHPKDAMLISGYSMRDRANESIEILAEATEEDLAYVIAEEKDLTIDNLKAAKYHRGQDTKSGQAAKQIMSEQGLALITAKRQLEEARLAMTSEANYALLKKGISIDTKPLVELVDALKSQEDSYYRSLLENEGIYTEENASVLKETEFILEDLKTAPASIIKPQTEDTLHSLHQEANLQKEAYQKANESYEALMTAPRKDMGDSIQKAFRNVDDILMDLGLETSDANRRAVRILSYNSMELTPDNIMEVKAKDEQMQRAFSNLTPKVTIEMIRKGINPLDMDMQKLNEVAMEIKREIGDEDTERFHKYLWKLEQNKSISEEERNSYIGIYRLIAQVEKADGAAVGSLMEQDVDITMRSLLTAMRTAKKTSMDYQVDDHFSGVDNTIKNERIDKQILSAYQNNCMQDAMEQLTPKAAEELLAKDIEGMTPEQVKEIVEKAKDSEDAQLEQNYRMEQLKEYGQTLTTEEEVYTFLDRNNLPNTMQNLEAVWQMLTNRNKMFDTLWNAKGATAEAMEKVAEMKELILERFGEAVKSPTEMADAQEALAELAEHVMDTMIVEKEQVSTVDIKELRLMRTQFSICAKQTEEESYMIPMQTSEGVSGVSLKIVRGTKQKGMVDILFHGNIMGKVAASFEAKENGISGMLATDNEETRQLLSDHLGMLVEALNEDGKEAIDLRVAKFDDASMDRYVNRATSRQDAYRNDVDEEANHESDYQIQTSRLYHMAESFIKTIQEFL